MPSKRPTPPSDSSDDQLAFDLPDDNAAAAADGAASEATAAAPGITPPDALEEIPTGPRPHPALASTSFGRDGTPLRLSHVGEMYGHWFLDYASYVIL